MVNFVLIQVILGVLLLKLRRLLTPLNMFYFMAGSLTGSMGSFVESVPKTQTRDASTDQIRTRVGS